MATRAKRDAAGTKDELPRMNFFRRLWLHVESWLQLKEDVAGPWPAAAFEELVARLRPPSACHATSLTLRTMDALMNDPTPIASSSRSRQQGVKRKRPSGGPARTVPKKDGEMIDSVSHSVGPNVRLTLVFSARWLTQLRLDDRLAHPVRTSPRTNSARLHLGMSRTSSCAASLALLLWLISERRRPGLIASSCVQPSSTSVSLAGAALARGGASI